MAGFSNAEAQATLDQRFPTTGATDYVGYSTNGTSEFAGLARTFVTATGWAAATAADPSVKANSVQLITADASSGGTVTHFAVFNQVSAGTQRTDWQALDQSKTVAIGDALRWAVGQLKIRLT